MARLFEAVFLSGLGVCIYGCAGAGMMAAAGWLTNIEPTGGRGLDGRVAWRLLVLNPARGRPGSVCWMAGFSCLV